MNPKSGYLLMIIAFLYLTIPLIGYNIIGTMVTEKYQIDHARIFLDIGNNKIPSKERQIELDKIQKLENELRLTQYTLIGLAIISFLTATGLLVYRNKILKKAGKHQV